MQNRLIERISRARLIAVLALAGLTAATPVAIGSFIELPARAHTQLATAGASDFQSFAVRSKVMRERGRCRMFIGLDREMRVTDCTLLDLVAVAYGVSPAQVVTGQWHTDAAFDIAAKVPRGVELEAAFSWLQDNMRELLAQRLGVVIKSERRQVDGYALEVGVHGSKLRRTSHNFFVVRHVVVGPGSIDMIDFPPSALAGVLSNSLGAPVADQTGLQGSYDYQLRWVQSAPAKSVDPAVLIKSVAEQLGLRIEARPVTVEMVSVISVNPPGERMAGRHGDTLTLQRCCFWGCSLPVRQRRLPPPRLAGKPSASGCSARPA